MHENVRPAQTVSVIRSTGVLRFGLLVAFTLTLTMVITMTFSLPYGTWDAIAARYPAHALIVVWVSVVGVLWLRLQERSELPDVSPVLISRRIVLIAAILISVIPPRTIISAAIARPMQMTEALGTALVGLVLWQHLGTHRRVHKLSDGLESLVMLIMLQLIPFLAGIASVDSFLMPLNLIAGMGIAGPITGVILARRAMAADSGAGHAALTIALVVVEFFVLVRPVS